MSDIRTIAERHREVVNVHPWDRGRHACVEDMRDWPCDARILAAALAAAEAERDANADIVEAQREIIAAAEADADALAEALRDLVHQEDGTPNILRDDFPDGGDIVLRWEGNRQDWQHAIDSVAAHDARRQPK